MKAHSERVPGKNFKEFNGKPLFEWVLDKLIDIDQISRVIINTDAVDKLLSFEICHNEKVCVRQRDKSIIGDFVSMNKIIESDIQFSNDQFYLMTHTTNPLVSKQTFSNAISEFENCRKGGYDSLFSCNQFKSRFYNHKNEPINHDPQKMIRTQDLNPIFEENSCIYIFSKESFKLTNARIGLNPKVFVTPEWESVDIDNPDDWNKATVYQKIINNEI